MDITKDDFRGEKNPYRLHEIIRDLQRMLKQANEDNKHLRGMVNELQEILNEQQQSFDELLAVTKEYASQVREFDSRDSFPSHQSTGLYTDDDYEPGKLKLNITKDGTEIITPKRGKLKGVTFEIGPRSGASYQLLFDDPKE